MLVRDRQGQELGRVVRLLETGAHDVLVLDGQPERLIPFVLGAVVESVDLDARSLTVTWDAGFWEP
jgi:16S rRNA processing protein RimM